MSTEVPEFEIRLMKKEELFQVINLKKELNFIACSSLFTWFEYDPDGFYVAVTKDGNFVLYFLLQFSAIVTNKNEGCIHCLQ